MKNKRGRKKVFIFILLIAVLLAVPFMIKKPVKTISAGYSTYEDKSEFRGIYFSQENVVYKGETKDLGLKYKNGERVPKGAEICSGVFASQPGVIITSIDGCENKYNLSNIIKVSAMEIDDINKNAEEIPGIKIINNSELYLYIYIRESKKFLRGSIINLLIGDSYYGAEVISSYKDNEGMFLILRMKDDMDFKNIHREISGHIVNSKYNGIVVPDESILRENDKDEVLVKSGGYAEPRQVKILYRGRGIAVVVPDLKAKRQLQEYDDIICDASKIHPGDKLD